MSWYKAVQDPSSWDSLLDTECGPRLCPPHTSGLLTNPTSTKSSMYLTAGCGTRAASSQSLSSGACQAHLEKSSRPSPSGAKGGGGANTGPVRDDPPRFIRRLEPNSDTVIRGHVDAGVVPGDGWLQESGAVPIGGSRPSLVGTVCNSATLQGSSFSTFLDLKSSDPANCRPLQPVHQESMEKGAPSQGASLGFGPSCDDFFLLIPHR